PLRPLQDHVHGPVPATAVGVPALQRLTVGATATATPFAVPQRPGTGVGVLFAEQAALVPPLRPVQVHVQGSMPATAVAVPALQRLPPEGAVGTVVRWADPQTPATGTGSGGAVQNEAAPPLRPSQDQVQGPAP